MKLFELKIHLSDEQREDLEKNYKKGYRYAVQENDNHGILLFSLKPKKYTRDGFWGYQEKDLESVDALPAFPLSFQVDCIKWTNRQATLISELLGMGEAE